MIPPAKAAARILVIDDKEQVREALRLRIETTRDECRVATAASGEEALARLAGRDGDPEEFDIVLCDLKLRGGIDGIEVTHRVRATCPGTRIVIFTGKEEGQSKKEALEAGAFSYLSKPVDYDELLHTIDNVNSIRRTERLGEGFRRLAAISSDLQASFELEHLVSHIVEGALELGYTRARLYLFDKDQQALLGKAARGPGHPKNFTEYRIPFESGNVISKIFEAERPTICNKKKLVELFGEPDYEPWLTELNLHEISWIDCPLRVKNRRIGTLAVDHYGQADACYTQDDLEILGIFAGLAAQALNNSRLYEKEALANASLSSIVRDAPDVVVTTDLHGIVTFVSPSSERVIGYLPDEMVGHPAKKFYTDLETSADAGEHIAREIMTEVKKRGAITGRAVYLQAPKGPPLPVTTSISLLHDEAGNEIGTLAFLKSRSPLETQSERYRELLEGFGHGTLLLTPEGDIDFVNRKAEHLLGRTRQDAQGQSFADLLMEPQGEQFRAAFQKILAGQGETTLDLHVTRPSSRGVAVRANLTPMRKDGEVTGVALALYDKSELAALIQSGRLMALGQMVAGVAHEINNPLNNLIVAFRGIRDRLSGQSLLADPYPRYLDIVEADTQRIQRIVQRMKEFARPSDFELGPLSLNEVIEASAAFFATRFRNHNIDFQLHLAPGLPPVLGDRTRLEQIFVNLIVNAEEAMEGQSEPKEIIIETGEVGLGQICARVTDSGSGIPEGIHDAIFDPFFTTKSADTGTGLGLSICKSILDMHEGSIHASSRTDGRGATFTVVLKCASESNEKPS